MGKWVHRLAEVDIEKKSAVCANCGPTDIYLHDKGGGRSRWHCGEARRARARERSKTPAFKAYSVKYQKQWRVLNKDNVSKINRRQLLKHHGLTEADYDRMVAERDGCCDLCKEAVDKLCVDHCHETMRIRGLLCLRCNLGLGFFKDRPEVAARVAAYLA